MVPRDARRPVVRHRTDHHPPPTAQHHREPPLGTDTEQPLHHRRVVLALPAAVDVAAEREGRGSDVTRAPGRAGRLRRRVSWWDHGDGAGRGHESARRRVSRVARAAA